MELSDNGECFKDLGSAMSDDEPGNVEKRKNRNYQQADLDKALKEIANGMTIYAASRKHGVPESTLRLRRTGCGDKVGRETLLSDENEKKLVEWIKMCGKRGNGKTRKDILTAASELLQLQSRSVSLPKLTNGWLKCFMQRHRDISPRKPQSVTKASASVTKEDVKKFHRNIYDWLKENDFLHLLDMPQQWVNSDETGFEHNPKPKIVFGEKGSKVASHVEAADPSKRTSAMFTFGGDGASYRPQLIFKNGLRKIDAIHRKCGEIGADFYISQTDKGFQDQKSFENYVKESLIPELDARGVKRDARNPVLYFIDGHASHTSIEFFFWCRQNHIHIIKFLPNATRILQMCDVSMYGPAKTYWVQVVESWKRDHRGDKIDEIVFVSLLKEVCTKFIKEESIKAGWKATGWIPFNVENIHFDRCLGTSAADAALQDQADQNEPTTSLDLSPQQSQPNVFVQDDDTSDSEPSTFEFPAQQLLQVVMEQDESSNSSFGTLEPIEQTNSDVEVRLAIVTIEKSLQTISKYHPSLSTPVLFIKSQIECLQKVIRESSVTKTPTSTVPDINKILTPPQQFKRAGKHRNYKVKNCGVMTDDAAIESYQKVAAEKEQIAKKKEEARLKREQRKIFLETIKNIKQENKEHKKKQLNDQSNKENAEPSTSKTRATKRKADVSNDEPVLKKRGRPKKQ